MDLLHYNAAFCLNAACGGGSCEFTIRKHIFAAGEKAIEQMGVFPLVCLFLSVACAYYRFIYILY